MLRRSHGGKNPARNSSAPKLSAPRHCPTDARQDRSRRALTETLLALFGEMPFEQVTIREITARAEKFPAFITSLYAISQGRAVPSPGGVLVLDEDGEVLGAVGISGDTGDNDELCGLAGIKAAGFGAAPGKIAEKVES